MKILKVNSLLLVLGLMASGAFAQTRTDAVKLFNAGLEEAKAKNYEAAINTFTQAISVSEQLGAEGDDIKTRSEQQIPVMYYYIAKEAYDTYQVDRGISNLETAISSFNEAASAAREYNDERIANTVTQVIPQLYYQKSIIYFNQDDMAAADEAVNKALELNSNYALAYYQKAKIHKKINDTNDDGVIDRDLDGLLNWYDQAIAVASNTSSQANIAALSREAAHDELVAVGASQSLNDNTRAAIETLSRALSYDQASANAHYRLAEAYNKIGNSDKAVTHARQALEHEPGGRTDKAKIYFELGVAYQTAGQKSEACDALTNALFGNFRTNAEYKMQHELKCESTAN